MYGSILFELRGGKASVFIFIYRNYSPVERSLCEKPAQEELGGGVPDLRKDTLGLILRCGQEVLRLLVANHLHERLPDSGRQQLQLRQVPLQPYILCKITYYDITTTKSL